MQPASCNPCERGMGLVRAVLARSFILQRVTVLVWSAEKKEDIILRSLLTITALFSRVGTDQNGNEPHENTNG